MDLRGRKVGISPEIRLLRKLDQESWDKILISASKRGDFFTILNLFKPQSPIPFSLEIKNSSFYQAAENGFSAVVEFFLQRGLIQGGDAMKAAVCAAAQNGRVEVLKAFVRIEDMNLLRLYLCDGLKIAAQHGQGKVISLVLRSIREWSTNYYLGDSFLGHLNEAFVNAAKNGQVGSMNAFIQSGRFNDIALDEAFIGAAENGQVGFMNAIIQSGRFNAISGWDLGRAVVWSADNGHEGVLRTIIQSGRFDEIEQVHADLAFRRSRQFENITSILLSTKKIGCLAKAEHIFLENRRQLGLLAGIFFSHAIIQIL